jgi:hypothetical protein
MQRQRRKKQWKCGEDGKGMVKQGVGEAKGKESICAENSLPLHHSHRLSGVVLCTCMGW